MLRIKLLRCCIEWILTKDALYLLSYISMLLHRATGIYYHKSKEKARGNLQFSRENFCRAQKAGNAAFSSSFA